MIKLLRPKDERTFERFKKKIGIFKFNGIDPFTCTRARKVCEILCAFNPSLKFDISLEKVFIESLNSHRSEILFKIKEPSFFLQVGTNIIEFWINYTDPIKKDKKCIRINMTHDYFDDCTELLFDKNGRKININTLRFWYLIFKRQVNAYDRKRATSKARRKI